jgi:hypothetical protein
MGAEIVNLRLARKRHAREAKEEEAARNRRLHGETKAARQERRLSAEKAARDLEAHRREVSDQQPSLGSNPAEHDRGRDEDRR